MILQIVVLVMMVYVLSTSGNRNTKHKNIAIDKENTKEMTHLNNLRQISLSVPLTEKSRPSSFDEIIEKYVEMNVAHPFMEGNGRSTRIWLDLILKKNLKLCVDWSKINKKDYLTAMEESTMNPQKIKASLQGALTDKINDREMFMKGVDYSYYYEQENDIIEANS